MERDMEKKLLAAFVLVMSLVGAGLYFAPDEPIHDDYDDVVDNEISSLKEEIAALKADPVWVRPQIPDDFLEEDDQDASVLPKVSIGTKRAQAGGRDFWRCSCLKLADGDRRFKGKWHGRISKGGVTRWKSTAKHAAGAKCEKQTKRQFVDCEECRCR